MVFVNADTKAGVNVEMLRYWTRSIAFTNLLKSGVEWLSTSDGGAWNDGRAIDLDSNGYPQSALTGPDQWFTLIFLTDQAQNYPAGTYTIRFDGNGGWDGLTNTLVDTKKFGSVIAESDGEITVDWQTTAANQYIKFKGVDAGDHLRNLRILLPGFAAETETFHPDFVNLLADHFGALRFMDWQNINHSTVLTTADKTPVGYITYGDDEETISGGVPLEIQVALCNVTKCDFAYQAPHQANDAYHTDAAAYMAANLDPEVRVYLGFSNETWNSKFDQKDFCTAQGAARGLDAGGTQVYGGNRRFVSERTQEIFDLYGAHLTGGRMLRIVEGHAADDSNNGVMLDWPHTTTGIMLKDNADVLSVGYYFGGNLGTEPQATTSPEAPYTKTTINMTAKEIVAAAVLDSETRIAGFITANAALATAAGLDLMSYECGQHLVGVGTVENNDTITALFTAANIHEDMQPAYAGHMGDWPGSTAFFYMLTKRQGQKAGNWGMLAYQDQPIAEAPKWLGFLDWLNYVAPSVDVSALAGATALDLEIRPEVFAIVEEFGKWLTFYNNAGEGFGVFDPKTGKHTSVPAETTWPYKTTPPDAYVRGFGESATVNGELYVILPAQDLDATFVADHLRNGMRVDFDSREYRADPIKPIYSGALIAAYHIVLTEHSVA